MFPVGRATPVPARGASNSTSTQVFRFLRQRASTRDTGAKAEDEALAQLQAAGLDLVTRNYLARGGELDLVMRDGAILVFVEVRFRAQADHGDGLDSVAKPKQQRMLTAARQFVLAHPLYRQWPMRFDVVSLGAGGFRWERNVVAVADAW